jgi:CRP/FNR family cyclic AMP-dependent transcriptional regulator
MPELPAELRPWSIPRSLARGELLMREGERQRYLYFLEEGRIRLFRAQETLLVLSPGTLFGEEALLGEPALVSAESLAESRLQVLPQEVVWEHLGCLLPFLLRKLYQAQEHLRALRFRGVKSRLVEALLGATRAGERGLEVSLSHQELAYLASSTRETVTKVLGELAMEDLIDLGYRKIIILQPERLRSLE